MKRRIALLLVIILTFSTFLSFAAAETIGEAEGQFLKDQGIFEGDKSGSIMLDKPLKRQDAVVLLSRLMKEEDEAKSFSTESLTFEDIKNDYYKGYISWALENEYFLGHSSKKFGYDEDITIAQCSAIFLRALEYGDVAYEDAFEVAKELGLFKNLEDVLESEKALRGQISIIIVNALGTELKDSNETLAEKLGIELDIDTKAKILPFGNEFEIGTCDEFLTGELNNIEVLDHIGDGAIALQKIDGEYPEHGEYISPIIDVPKFEYLVMSWNSDTPEGTYVEVEGRVLVNHFDEEDNPLETWSDWLSWGEWSPHMARSSKSRRDELARMSVDQLIINGSKGETASKVQIKVNLYTEDPSVTPVVRYLHGTMKNTIEPIEKVFKEEIDVTNLDKDIDTPEYSQMIRNPGTSRSICSPTTITMMMNRFGETLLPDEVAQNTYDNAYGFGNWTFAMGTAGSYGYKAYLDFTTIEGLKREIAKGYPVGVSVKYTNDPEDDRYPYIEGSPGATPGHLIVVRGFTTIDGVEYIIVNDSYAPEDETVRRLYKLEEFDKAWSNRAAYIIRDKEENAGIAPTMRIEAELRKTDTPNEYAVFVGEENIDVTNFGGVIAYTLDDDLTHEYFSREDKNSLTFTEEEISNPKLKVYVITDTGKVYVAKYVE